MTSSNILLLPNEPHYTILAATPEFMAQTGTTKETLIGKGIFEAFPPNPVDQADTGTHDVSASLQQVILSKKPHQLPVQRYDVAGEGGTYNEKYWSASNSPVFDDRGEITCILHTTNDITEQVKSERREEAHQDLQLAYKKVHESEARFRSLLKAAPIGIGIYRGRELVIEMANAAMIDLLGKGNNVIGKRFAEVLSELENQPFLNVLDDVYTSGKMFETTATPANVVHNGELRRGYYDFSYTPLLDEHGKVYAILNIASEVTEQVQGRQALEESENNLRNTILQAPVAMCIFRGKHFVVEIANDKMYELFGRGKEEVLGKSIFEGLPEAKDQGYEERLTNVFTTGERFTAYGTPVTLPRNGGIETIYLNLLYEALREADGTITGIIAVAIDVSEQVRARKAVEESEQYARSLFYNSPVAMLVYVGYDMVLREANEKMLEIFGRGDSILGKSIMEAIPELKATPL